MCIICDSKYNKSENVSFFKFSFPNDHGARLEWCNVLGLDMKNLHPRTKICSKHFEETDILGSRRKVLKMGALPVRNIKMDVEYSVGELVENIKEEHNYCKRDAKLHQKKKRLRFVGDFTPNSMKDPLNALLFYNIASKKIKLLKNKLRVQAKKGVKNGIRRSEENSDVKNSYMLQKGLEQLSSPLKQLIEGILLKKRTHEPEVLAFIVNCCYYSTQCYKYLRTVFNLPCVSTISKIYSQIDGTPGFTAESLDILKKFSRNKIIYTALSMDEMSIRRHVHFDKNADKFMGYVDFRICPEKEDNVSNKVLVFMLTAVNDSWKIPLGYFNINGLTALRKAQLVNELFIFLKDCSNIEIVSLTFDGDPSNIKMNEHLGAAILSNKDLVAHFKHPLISGKRINVILDICHSIKLVRNVFEKKNTLIDWSGRKIRWDLVKRVQELQEVEGLLLGTKLTKNHINFHKQNQN